MFHVHVTRETWTQDQLLNIGKLEKLNSTISISYLNSINWGAPYIEVEYTHIFVEYFRVLE